MTRLKNRMTRSKLRTTSGGQIHITGVHKDQENVKEPTKYLKKKMTKTFLNL